MFGHDLCSPAQFTSDIFWDVGDSILHVMETQFNEFEELGQRLDRLEEETNELHRKAQEAIRRDFGKHR